jgi:hypothetical protein
VCGDCSALYGDTRTHHAHVIERRKLEATQESDKRAQEWLETHLSLKNFLSLAAAAGNPGTQGFYRNRFNILPKRLQQRLLDARFADETREKRAEWEAAGLLSFHTSGMERRQRRKYKRALQGETFAQAELEEERWLESRGLEDEPDYLGWLLGGTTYSVHRGMGEYTTHKTNLVLVLGTGDLYRDRFESCTDPDKRFPTIGSSKPEIPIDLNVRLMTLARYAGIVTAGTKLEPPPGELLIPDI